MTVYSPLEQRVVARCQGHSSFITSIAFDPWQTDERTSRFASVSEDCKVIFVSPSSLPLSKVCADQSDSGTSRARRCRDRERPRSRPDATPSARPCRFR